MVSLNHHRARRGSLILEAAISSVLLITATVALLKFAKSAAVLGQQADQRLALTLAAQNAIERLQSVPFDKVDREADTIATDVSDACRCDVSVEAESFMSMDQNGIHMRVDARLSESVFVTLHGWRLEAKERENE